MRWVVRNKNSVCQLQLNIALFKLLLFNMPEKVICVEFSFMSQVQLPSGDLVVQTFGVNEPLSAVRLYLQMNHLKVGVFDS